MTIPFTYSHIAVGVNETPRATTLRFAERDAVRIALAQAGQLGPVLPENAAVLLGPKATACELDRALAAAARQRPTFFSFYFGGHGNQLGIGLANKLYPFSRLRDWVARIGARGTIVMLNCCGAGGFAKSAVAGLAGVPDLSIAWTAALFAAVPGARVFMASSADAYTLERADVGGVYAHALINAMQAPRPGDLDVMGYQFVSDRLVCTRATQIMARYGLQPEYAGAFGGFPMVLANIHPVGETDVTAIAPVDDFGVTVNVAVRDRRYLPTTIVATATDAFGNRWPSQRVVALPDGQHRQLSATFDIDATQSFGARMQLWQHGACRLTWNIDVMDTSGRLLAQGRQVADYWI